MNPLLHRFRDLFRNKNPLSPEDFVKETTKWLQQKKKEVPCNTGECQQMIRNYIEHELLGEIQL